MSKVVPDLEMVQCVEFPLEARSRPCPCTTGRSIESCWLGVAVVLKMFPPRRLLLELLNDGYFWSCLTGSSYGYLDHHLVQVLHSQGTIERQSYDRIFRITEI